MGNLMQNEPEIAQRTRAKSVQPKPKRKKRRSGALKRDEMATIYFVQPIDGGLIKIGIAMNPVVRLKDMQVGSPMRLHILATCPGDTDDAHSLHWRFKGYHRHGEWHDPGADLLAFIESLHENPDPFSGWGRAGALRDEMEAKGRGTVVVVLPHGEIRPMPPWIPLAAC